MSGGEDRVVVAGSAGREGMAEVLERPFSAAPASLTAKELQQRARKRRYEIWSAQIAAGKEPCFGTARRFLCDEPDCAWREECLRLRAQWMV